MFKKRYLFLFLCILLTVFFFSKYHNPSISKVLEKEEYSYLPKEAKNYIEAVYEETGEVVKTEKNKEENVPYLNPKYIRYLSLSAEEKEHIDEIPSAYVVDYSLELSEDKASLPSTYDLRNVNGKNYTTPIKDQKTLDLCWDFTSIEQIESYLMIKKNQPYSSSTEVFSTRQMDYASSTNGIKDYENDYGTRKLGEGGNFLVSSLVMENGLSLVSDSLMPFSSTTATKELADVLNYDRSSYELNTSVLMPTIDSNSTSEDLENHISTLKQFVMDNGGAYIGTQAPGYSCSSQNTDGNTIIRVDDTCIQDGGHAMQIIGWDDNYSYSYCKGNAHSSLTSQCSSANTVRGTGAWLLRNSWGDSYSYVYLAYDSLEDDVYIYTDLSSMKNRSWDNNYHKSIDAFYVYYRTTDSQTFEKNIDTTEKVEKVKFFSFGKGGKFRVSVTSSKESYQNIKTVSVDYPGIYTIDLSDENIIVTDSSFQVTITSTNNVSLLTSSMSVFTSNVDTNPIIQTNNNSLTFNTSSSGYSSRLYSITKNIKSNQSLSYSLYNYYGENVSNYLTSFQNNRVGINNVNALISIQSSIPNGLYTLKITYLDAEDDILINIGNISYYSVQFMTNDGSNTSTLQNVPSGYSFELDPNTFTRVGYEFKNWNTKADGTGTAYSDGTTINSINNNLVLYAQWNPITYSVSFHANGGEGEMSNQSFTYDVSQKLKDVTFTYEGYSFVSWNTKADGSGTSYSSLQEVVNLSSIMDEVIPLYAQWREKGAYEIQGYVVDEESKTIDSISLNTSLNDYLENFVVGDDYQVEVDLKGKNTIFTGSKTRIMKNNVLIVEYTNIVRGDVNGDGIVNSADLLKIVKHLKGTALLSDFYEMSADPNRDNKINSADLLKIVKYLKGTGTI